MKHTRFVSLALCAALLVGLLAGCGSTASTSSGSAAASTSAASESLSRTEASTSGLFSDEENSIFSVDGTAEAFQPCLGWGPGVSGCTLKSVIAAASLLQWAEDSRLALRSEADVKEVFHSWYDELSADEQEMFAEAWAMIREDAETLMTDKESIAGLIDDAGLDGKDLPGCTLPNWEMLKDVLDAEVPEVVL